MLHPGDKVTLQISRGPAPVDVPDIIGMTWTQAKAALDAAFALQTESREGMYSLGASKPSRLNVVAATLPSPGFLMAGLMASPG